MSISTCVGMQIDGRSKRLEMCCVESTQRIQKEKKELVFKKNVIGSLISSQSDARFTVKIEFEEF